jgi:hypothetical protein
MPFTDEAIERLKKAMAQTPNVNVPMSYPATTATTATITATQVDTLRASGPDDELPYPKDLIDPPVGYPFVEWEDLTDVERGMVLHTHITRQTKVRLEQQSLDDLLSNLLMYAKVHCEDVRQAMSEAQLAYQSALRQTENLRKAEAEAKKGLFPPHLKGTPEVIARVQRSIATNTAYIRTVTFSYPVPAYTMTYGDRVAQPGDMLTGITTDVSKPYQQVDSTGRITTYYRAPVMSL